MKPFLFMTMLRLPAGVPEGSGDQPRPQQMKQQQQRESLQEDLDSIKSSFDSIDQATTVLGTSTTAVKTRIDNLLSQIPSAATLQEAKDLAARALGETAPLTAISDSLAGMAADPANPVPVPPVVVNPDPTQPATPAAGDGGTGGAN